MKKTIALLCLKACTVTPNGAQRHLLHVFVLRLVLSWYMVCKDENCMTNGVERCLLHRFVLRFALSCHMVFKDAYCTSLFEGLAGHAKWRIKTSIAGPCLKACPIMTYGV